MDRNYKCLAENSFFYEGYRLVPIRDRDKYDIMQWRNEQINILRQSQPITAELQDHYFSTTVDKLFEEDQPSQILWSILLNDQLIGYGGLVHIDWESQNAEISFLINTERNADQKMFEEDFTVFLQLMEKIAFKMLGFLKLHTTCYDIPERAFYINVLTDNNFVLEGRLHKHLLINGSIKDVLFFSYFKS